MILSRLCVCAPVLITVNGLAGNAIGDAGAKDLSVALCKCSQLQMLNLSCQCLAHVSLPVWDG